MFNIADHSPAQPHCRHRVPKIAFHQNDIRALHGHIRAGADGHPHIRRGKGRRIVDPVADHGHLMPCRPQCADLLLLILGQHLCDDLLDPQTLPHGLRSPPVVSREHDHMDSHLLPFTDGFPGSGLYLIGHPDHSQETAFLRHQKRCHALPGDRVNCLLYHCVQTDALFLQISLITHIIPGSGPCSRIQTSKHCFLLAGRDLPGPAVRTRFTASYTLFAGLSCPP